MKTKCFFSGIIATLALFLIHLIIYPYLFYRNIGNLTYYVIISAVFVAIFFFALYCLNFCEKDCQIDFGRLSILYSAGFLCWFVLMYFYEKDSYYFSTEFSLRHRIPFYLYFFFIILCTVLVYFILSFNIIRNLKFLRVIFLIFLSSLQTIVLAAPNIINDRGGNLFHIHAYFNPIYNVYKGFPYDEYLSSIYGHYPFFYYIPMKILSLFNISLVHSAMAITMFFGFVSFILLYFGMSRLIKNNGLFFISVLASSYISFYYYQTGQYYQMIPHRILFPSITIFIFSLFVKKKIPAWVTILVSSFALLWNFESGILCLISLTVYMFLQRCSKLKVYENDEIGKDEDKTSDKNESKQNKVIKIVKNIENNFVFSFVIAGFSFVLSFALALFLMNIFNILFGGKIRSLVDLCYPLMSKNDYELSDISIAIPSVFNMFFIDFTLFLFVDCFLFIKIIKRNIEYIEIVIFSIALLGLGLLPYYFNRPAFCNISIAHIPFITVLGLCFEQYIQCGLNKFKKAYIYSVSLIISLYILGALSGIPLTLKNRIETSWKMDSLYFLCEIMEEYIPKDTPAVGPGLPDIYTYLRWNPEITVMDWSDWNCSEEKKNYALELINREDSILLSNASGVIDYLESDDWIIVLSLMDSFFYMIRVPDGINKKDCIIEFANENDISDDEFVDLCYLNKYHCFPDAVTKDYLTSLLDLKFDRDMLYYYIVDDSIINELRF